MIFVDTNQLQKVMIEDKVFFGWIHLILQRMHSLRIIVDDEYFVQLGSSF